MSNEEKIPQVTALIAQDALCTKEAITEVIAWFQGFNAAHNAADECDRPRTPYSLSTLLALQSRLEAILKLQGVTL